MQPASCVREFLEFAAALACGCGAAAGTAALPDAAVAASCVGAIPANAAPCPGADQGLTGDVARSLAAWCSGVPCSWICSGGYELRGGACEAAPPAAAGVQYADNGDGTVTVTDSIGRLVWLEDANCAAAQGLTPDGAMTWWQAEAWVAGLGDGACRLHDGSAPGDWRLPDKRELLHLELLPGNPFRDVQGGPYWSSFWLDGICTAVQGGQALELPAGTPAYAWPVR